jgi:hypothetical protein
MADPLHVRMQCTSQRRSLCRWDQENGMGSPPVSGVAWAEDATALEDLLLEVVGGEAGGLARGSPSGGHCA